MSSPDSEESPLIAAMKGMTPNQRFEYHIQHMGDPEFKQAFLKTLDLTDPAQKLEYDIENSMTSYRLEKRKPLPPAKLLKSFDPETVYLVLLNLRTPATFSTLKNSKDRLNGRITATSLRQYVDALLTRGYITLADFKKRERDYPGNYIPRTDFTFLCVSTRGGKEYVRAYKKVLDMLSELDPKARQDLI